jgi:2,5-furandicarboxylate decarboxylase 1
MAKDLMTYLEDLKEAAPQQMRRVSKEISPDFEPWGILRNLEAQGLRPVVLFDKVKDRHGRATHQMIANLFAGRIQQAVAMGLGPEQSGVDLTWRISKLARELKKPVAVDSKVAPVKQVIRKGKEADLLSLPVGLHHEKDAGPYILAAFCVEKDPETGLYNASMVRMQVKEPQKSMIHIGEGHHNEFIYSKYEKKGQAMPVAAVIGHHPAFYMGSQYESAGSQAGIDEYEIIGGLLQEPLRVVPSETFGSDLMVPADAEIVIEGRALPHVREPEGPICEHTRYYKAILGDKIIPHEAHVFEVTAITHKKDPVYLGCFIGHADQNLIGSIPKEGAVFNAIKMAAPGVTGVNISLSGCGRYICYISLKQRAAGQAKNAILAAMAADWHFKYVIAVDEDINVYDEADVLWALSLRSQPNKDIFIVPDAMGARLDPSTPLDDRFPYSSKMGIDATKPYGQPFSAIGEIPKEVLERMVVDEYVEPYE